MLSVASWPYGAVSVLRNLAYDRGWRTIHRAPVPVISVGNLTVGGTGKTPCVEYLARWLRLRDVRVAILSRGYGATNGPNDEALVLDENLPDVPHLQGADRVELAATAVEELESEVLLLDDGFQHRRLARHVDIVLIDATNPWGYGGLLPRGLLREPVRSLRRASAVIITRCEQSHTAEIEQRIRRVAPNLPELHSEHRPVAWRSSTGEELPLDSLRDKKVKAFCGIGNPGAFRRTLEQIGLTVIDFREFADHHRYVRSDVESLEDWSAAGDSDAVVTTQKDLVKLRIDRLGHVPLFALRITLHITKGEETLHQLLMPFLPN
jgi:tetraacyldisaccharide 4'-kinase